MVTILCDRYKQHEGIIRLAFTRNDYLNNATSSLFLSVPGVRQSFEAAWNEVATKCDLSLEWQDISDDAKLLNTVQDPILEMKIYGMNLLLGSSKGLFHSNLNIEDDLYHIHPSKLEKRFDAKVIGLTAKYGCVAISTGKDGLFNLSLFDDSFKIDERPIAPISYRTGWSSTDIVNYESKTSFDYLENKVEKNSSMGWVYSKFDEKKEKNRIIQVAEKTYRLEELNRFSNNRLNNVVYCFNSSESSFFISNDGIYTTNFMKDKNKGVYLSSRSRKNTWETKYKFGNPLSAHIIPKGCVIEMFDNVLFSRNGVIEELDSHPAVSVRSYINSIRYRNLVSVVNNDYLSIYSVEPFYEPILKYASSFRYSGINDFDGGVSRNNLIKTDSDGSEVLPF